MRELIHERNNRANFEVVCNLISSRTQISYRCNFFAHDVFALTIYIVQRGAPWRFVGLPELYCFKSDHVLRSSPWHLGAPCCCISQYFTSVRHHVYVTSDSPQVALSLSFASKSITPFAPRNHGDDSTDGKMCELQEVWATS